VLADERLIAHAPASIPLAHAAALPLISITAWQAIRDTGVKAGDKVLVFGGSGNVGRMGIQLAKLQGALREPQLITPAVPKRPKRREPT
jgi:NADPH2:quinone reductase